MNQRLHIQNELEELNSLLPAVKPSEVFTVPQGYFDQFAASVLARIRAEEPEMLAELEELSPLLASIPRQMPYEVPSGYFEGTSSGLSFLKGDEVLPPIFQSIGKEQPYTVPAGYFEQLPSQVLARIEQPKAKVVSMPRKWMRMAVAAAIAGLIAVSGFWYYNQSRTISVDDPKWIAQQIKTVDTKSLETFIKAADVTTESSQTVKSKPSGEDVKTLLKDVSTSELESFLEQVPTDDEDLMFN
jgi:hypothetical protein